jgi:hypothetical protein
MSLVKVLVLGLERVDELKFDLRLFGKLSWRLLLTSKIEKENRQDALQPTMLIRSRAKVRFPLGC